MDHESRAGGLVRAPQNLAAGLFLVALGLFALWAGRNLNAGTLASMGPGMVPRAVAVMIIIVGAIVAVGAFIWHGPSLDTVSIRGPLFITLGILAFGLTIRGFRIPLPGGAGLQTPALGLIGAGPLAIMIAGFASAETRWRELVIFTIVMTVFCWLLFKVALNLPIPLMPLLLGQ